MRSRKLHLVWRQGLNLFETLLGPESCSCVCFRNMAIFSRAALAAGLFASALVIFSEHLSFVSAYEPYAVTSWTASDATFYGGNSGAGTMGKRQVTSLLPLASSSSNSHQTTNIVKRTWFCGAIRQFFLLALTICNESNPKLSIVALVISSIVTATLHVYHHPSMTSTPWR